MTNFNIKQANNNETIDGVFLVNSVTDEKTSTGNSFLSIILSNKNGDITCKVWNSTEDDYCFFKNNSVIKVRATVNEYKDNKQLIIKRYKKDEETNINELITSTVFDTDEMYNFIINTIEEIENKTLKTITRYLITDNEQLVKIAGAAKMHHHGFRGGLLEHTYTMLKNGLLLMDSYKNNINKDLLISGIILHDIGKTKEYKFKSYGVVEDYSVEGELLGHITIGISMITEYFTKLSFETTEKFDELTIILLKHLILTHHGQPEFGSPKYPMIKEAELLSYLDMLDTKMNMFDKINNEIDSDSFSQRQWSLNSRKIYNHEL